MTTELSNKELLDMAEQMKRDGDILGLLHLNAVLTVALYPVTGRNKILSDLSLAGVELEPFDWRVDVRTG